MSIRPSLIQCIKRPSASWKKGQPGKALGYIKDAATQSWKLVACHLWQQKALLFWTHGYSAGEQVWSSDIGWGPFEMQLARDRKCNRKGFYMYVKNKGKIKETTGSSWQGCKTNLAMWARWGLLGQSELDQDHAP